MRSERCVSVEFALPKGKLDSQLRVEGAGAVDEAYNEGMQLIWVTRDKMAAERLNRNECKQML